MTQLEDNELFRFEEIAYDVGLIFGSTTAQGLKRARRCLNRAMIDLAGHDRRWSWLRVKDSFITETGVREYSLNADVRVLEHRMWMQGATRGSIDRLPSAQFVERVPNPDDSTGTPRLFDEEGVDSSGCKVVSLYPVPPSDLEIFYRYSRHIAPISEGSTDVRVAWGLPQNLLGPLTKKAAAFALLGVSGERAEKLEAQADAEIEAAYGADQAKPYTSYRAPMQDTYDALSDGPMLPPQFGRE